MTKRVFSPVVVLCCTLFLVIHAYSEIEEGVKIERGVKLPAAGVIRGKADVVLKRINAFCVANRFKPWDIDLNRGQEKVYDGTPLEGDLFWFLSPDFVLSFQPSSGMLVECQNSKLDQSVTQLNGKTRAYIHKPESKWTRDYAVKIARAFIEACLGEMPKNIGAPDQVEFQQRVLGLDKETKKLLYGVPHWNLFFPRVDKNGYKFQEEAIIVTIFEDAGPTTLGVRMPSRYEEVSGEPLKQEEVMPEAVAYAKKLTNRSGLSGMFGGGTINETPLNARLEIVKPNNMGELRNLDSDSTDLNARLAWVICFDWTKSRSLWSQWTGSGSGSSDNKGEITVWIDAHTKKPLGGDYCLP